MRNGKWLNPFSPTRIISQHLGENIFKQKLKAPKVKHQSSFFTKAGAKQRPLALHNLQSTNGIRNTSLTSELVEVSKGKLIAMTLCSLTKRSFMISRRRWAIR